jgi:hypothetical protein
MIQSPTNHQNNCKVSHDLRRKVFRLMAYVAKMLLIGRPMPIRGRGPELTFVTACLVLKPGREKARPVPLPFPTCSSTVARMPPGLELTVRSPSMREVSNLVALRTCENDNRSEGDFICGLERPPPVIIKVSQTQ